MNDDPLHVKGGCYCGKVRYSARLPGPGLIECHCTQCRRQAGHRYAAAITSAGNVEVEGGEGVTWFRASSEAERGFCATCGSHLFWKSTQNEDFGLLAASIEDAPALRLAKHIFVEDKGSYYEIADGLPQFNGFDRPAPDET